MAINLDNIELMGYSHNFNTLGDSRHYSCTQNYNIRGYILADHYENGSVTEISSKTNAITSNLSFQSSDVYVNGIYLGFGKVSSINYEDSTDASIRRYSATIEIPLVAGSGMFDGTGYVNNTGLYFSGSNNYIHFFATETGKYIKNFSINCTSEEVGKGKYTYSRSANFTIDRKIVDEFAVESHVYAKRLIGAIASSYGVEYEISPDYPNFYKLSSGISKTTQSFDTVNGTYSYNEKFSFESGINYIWKYNHSVNDDGKIKTVDENGVITSSAIAAGSAFQSAATAWQTIETGAYSRCNEVYQGYFAYLASNLYNYPVSSSVTRDRCAGTIEYSKSYSDSPFVRSGYYYSYSDSVDYGEDGYITIGENGTFRAISNINSTGFQVVYNAYNAEKPLIIGRITGFYGNSTGYYNTECSSLSGGLKSIGKTETFKEYDAEIGYSWTLTDNPSYHEDEVSYSYKKDYTDSKSVHLFNYFPIAGSEIIAQSSNQATRGQFSNNISIIGKSGVSISSLVAKALSGIRKPSGTDLYINNYTYSYSPLNRNFSMNLDYLYTYYRDNSQFLAY